MICSVCGNYNPDDAAVCLRCGSEAGRIIAGARYQSSAADPPIYQLGPLANALTVLFAIAAALLLLSVANPPKFGPAVGSGIYIHGFLSLLSALLMLVTVVVFVTWFYRARKNAAMSTWRQRWSPGWAIGSWFLPPVLLWFPYQIMADIWRAGRPPAEREGASNAVLPGLWWLFWIMAWVTSFQRTSHTTSGSGTIVHATNYSLNFGGTRLSAAFAAAAAITLIMIIRRVSAPPR